MSSIVCQQEATPENRPRRKLIEPANATHLARFWRVPTAHDLVTKLHPNQDSESSAKRVFRPARAYLEQNPGDLVGLAQILGHNNLNTTRRYVERTQDQLGEAVEELDY